MLVDAAPGRLAVPESIPIACPASARPGAGDVGADRVAGGASSQDAYLDLTVDTSAVDVTLGQRAREAFPFLVNVRPRRREADPAAARETRRGRSLPDLYDAYFRQEHPDEEPPKELLDLFRDVLEEADAADATA